MTGRNKNLGAVTWITILILLVVASTDLFAQDAATLNRQRADLEQFTNELPGRHINLFDKLSKESMLMLRVSMAPTKQFRNALRSRKRDLAQEPQ